MKNGTEDETTPETKPGRVIRTREEVRHKFTEAEMVEISRRMARGITDLIALQEEKKRITAQFGTQIQAEQAKLGELSRSINSGHEYRTVDCEIHFHVPEKGMKSLIQVETGEVVWERKMELFELQEILFEEPPTITVEAEAQPEYMNTVDALMPEPAKQHRRARAHRAGR